MATIKFLEDKNGKYQVADLIKEIGDEAKRNGELSNEYAEISARIYQVMMRLRNTGVPPKHLRTLFGKSLSGNPITLTEIVKELDNHPPLLEIRVNWPPVGAFRAIFFYINDSNNIQTIYFTKAVIKPDTYSEAFEVAAKESERIMKEFIHKP